MKWHNISIRVGTLAVLVAMLLRFALSASLGNVWGLFAQPELASFLLYSETGRSPDPTAQGSTTAPTEPPRHGALADSAHGALADSAHSALADSAHSAPTYRSEADGTCKSRKTQLCNCG